MIDAARLIGTAKPMPIFPRVAEEDFQFVCALDHVVISKDVAVRGNNYARTESILLVRPALNAAGERIDRELIADDTFGINRYDRFLDWFHNVRIAGDDG